MTAKARQSLVVLLTAVLVAVSVRASSAAPPELTMVRGEEPAVAGEPYTVVLEVAWQGGADAYGVLPAEAASLEWGTARVVESRSFERDGQYVVAQTVEIIANAPGDYEVPGMQIGLSNPEATVPSETAEHETTLPDPGAYPMLQTDPFPLRVRSARSGVWHSGGLGALLFLLLLAMALGGLAAARRRSRPRAVVQPDSPVQLAQQALVQARRARMDGDLYAFYLSLHEAVSQMGAGPPYAELAGRLAEQAQNTGYRGAKPAPGEMEADLKEVERCLAQTS